MHIYYFLFCFLLIAMIMDLQSYKVKNQVIIVGFAIGTLLLLKGDGIQALEKGFLNMLFLFLLMLPMFAISAIGAADVKLILLLGLLLEIRAALLCTIISLIIGSIYSLLQMLYYKNLLERFLYFYKYVKNFLKTGQFQPYHKKQPDKQAVIHFTIPIFISFCIYLTGGDLWITF